MDSNNWQDLSLFDDIDDFGEMNERVNNGKAKSNARKRKWREIEAIKEQRRLIKDLSTFEQCSY